MAPKARPAYKSTSGPVAESNTPVAEGAEVAADVVMTVRLRDSGAIVNITHFYRRSLAKRQRRTQGRDNWGKSRERKERKRREKSMKIAWTT